jgi:hypothetical protein
MSLADLWANTLNAMGKAWWVEIHTQQPHCVYYFGPFVSCKQAEVSVPGYLSDLEAEGAISPRIDVKQCKPRELTIELDMPLSA